MAEMWQFKPLHRLIAAASLCVLARTVVGDGGGIPLVTAITKDAATSLYTAPLKDTRPLVLDLSGPIIWTTCDGPSHDTLDCNSDACIRAHRFHPLNGPHTGYGEPDAQNHYRRKCTAHPYNPVSGDTGSGVLTRVALSANATDGKNPLYAVSFTVVASCAPGSLLARLPAGATGVAGLARSGLALPAQVAGTQKVGNKFALCLPSANSGAGVAIFGGGPLFLLPPGRPGVNATLAGYTPLHKHGDSPGYYISADKGIAVNQARLLLDDEYGAPLILKLRSTIPYTALRSDVYRAFVKAFNQTTADRARMAPPAAAPFELCYNSTELGSTRLGYAVPQIDLMLEGGRNWTVFGGNSMVQVNDNTACLAFVEMKGEVDKAAPAVVIGGFQMENNLLVFDEEKQRLGFSSLLSGRQTTCSNFNFTMAA